MKFQKYLILFVSIAIFTSFTVQQSDRAYSIEEGTILSHIVDPQEQKLAFYWKDEEGKIIGNFKKLKDHLIDKCQDLKFAMNGGMYLKDRSPQGLFIQNNKLYKKLNTIEKAYGNFYMQPNGVFYLSNENEGFVCSTMEMQKKDFDEIKYATQSGPMLLSNGRMNGHFKKGSSNLHIRNAVGILPNGKILFAMSKQKINFFDLATYFKNKGCLNALYLDGFVSRAYLPAKEWEQTDGNFGVIIAETKDQ